MKQLTFLILVSVTMFLGGCLTAKKIQRNCDVFAKVCVIDKVTETIFRDTTIYRTKTLTIKLPSDTVRISELVQVINNVANFSKIHKKFGIIRVNVEVINSIMSINAYLDSLMLVPIHDTILLKKVIREEAIINTILVKHTPVFYKVIFWIFWIVVLFVVLYVFWYKKKFRTVFK